MREEHSKEPVLARTPPSFDVSFNADWPCVCVCVWVTQFLRGALARARARAENFMRIIRASYVLQQ